MKTTINGRVLELVLGDITEQEVDALVNAANSQLAGGGGVDGAIHDAGGPAIMQETDRRYPNGCPTGSAVISGAGNLRAKYVIHAVGPVWYGSNADENRLLASAFRASLQLAAQHGCRSIALPALSTGAYGYPLDKAASAAINVAVEFLRQLPADSPLKLVRFVPFSDDVMAAFQNVLNDEGFTADVG
jgi:O-acetyl-ADP-ribose deacetylase (regulator of RNase III)